MFWKQFVAVARGIVRMIEVISLRWKSELLGNLVAGIFMLNSKLGMFGY